LNGREAFSPARRRSRGAHTVAGARAEEILWRADLG
jgi:hypothetical protein